MFPAGAALWLHSQAQLVLPLFSGNQRQLLEVTAGSDTLFSHLETAVPNILDVQFSGTTEGK